jgi:hypothetical protein
MVSPTNHHLDSLERGSTALHGSDDGGCAMTVHQLVVRKHSIGNVIQREERTGESGKQELVNWAINKANDFVNYENQWGESLFIDWLTDSYGQERIQIWDEQSDATFPVIDIAISSYDRN